MTSKRKYVRGENYVVIVQSVSIFRFHLRCIAGEKMDFPGLKTNKQKNVDGHFGASWQLAHMTRQPDLGTVYQIGIGFYPALSLFADNTYGPWTLKQFFVK